MWITKKSMISPKVLGSKIKSLREDASMNQEELAAKVGISRVAISQIEQGNRGIEFLELAKIAEAFNLKTDYFLMDENLPEGVYVSENAQYDFIPEKLKSTILYILEKCAGKPNIGETVLYKLLYFIDFDHFEVYGRPVTGLEYINLQYGPVPAAGKYTMVIESMKANQELKIISQDYYGMKIKRYINLVEYTIDSLTAQEIKIIDDVINSMSDWSARKIEDYVHGDAPWRLTEDKEVIPYHLAMERQTPYTKNYDDVRQFRVTSAQDVLKEIGRISKEDYDYYEKL